MKKRIAIFLLAMVMLVGVIPAGIFTAYAESAFVTSDECIQILKKEEGFSVKPYYEENLLFAGTNEPNVKNSTQMGVLNSYFQSFIDAVRSTGGNNIYRNLIIQQLLQLLLHQLLLLLQLRDLGGMILQTPLA